MATPTTQLNATEQDTLVKQIGLALLRAAPRDWRRVIAHYRAVGRYHELTGEILLEDGTVQEWTATHDIATLFGRLRAGMYREGRGTWFNARYQLDHPSSYNLEYDREEPRWNLAPPPQAYSDELRMFPRAEENVPEWLRRRLSGLSAEQSAPRFRVARIFDGQDASGRPILNRPDLDDDELNRLLEYLNSAPVVLSERGFDLDRLAPAPVPKVPVAFHTDGVWIWPAAINYYLQEYRVAPESELVEHIRSTGFSLPEVPDQTLQAAAAHLSRTPGPPPVPPRPAPPRPPRPMPEATTTVAPAVPPAAPEPAPEPEPRYQSTPEPEPRYQPAPEPEPRYEDSNFDRPVHEEPEEAPAPAPPTTFVPAVSADPGPPTVVPPSEPEPAGPDTTADSGTAPARAAAPVHDSAPSPAPVPPSTPSDPALEALRRKLEELGVPEGSYRIGEPAQHGWSLEKVDSGWRAGWYDEDLANSAVFGDAADAAAFMLGKLLLDPAARAAAAADFDDATPITGLRSDRPRDDLRSDRPREDVHAGRPREDLRPEPSREDLRADHTREDVRPDRFREDVRPEPPREDLRPDRAREDARPGFREDVRPDRFQDDMRSEHTREDARPGFREDMRSDRLRDDVRPDHPREDVRPPEPPAPPSPLAERLNEPEPAVGEPTMLAQPVSAPPPPAAAAPPPPPPAARRDAPPRRAETARPAASAGSGGSGQQWPIQPLPGEPPLTLFRGKEMRELPPGSELDRFGNPNGNLTYAAGTPFEERSLVPEWVNRPYHVYRVQRPIEVLAGVAIPWFNQPGGGAAYLLPASIEELLAEGDLIELEPGEPPIN